MPITIFIIILIFYDLFGGIPGREINQINTN
jgi:hypothetical protein